MKTLFLSFLTLLAFTACNDAYEQMTDDSTQTSALSLEANGEKFEYGKMYPISKLPNDIYNYIDRDSLNLFISTYKSQMDSIGFVTFEDFLKKHRNHIIQTRSSEDETDYYLASYYDNKSEKYFDLYVNGGAERLPGDIVEFNTAINVKIKPTPTISKIALFVLDYPLDYDSYGYYNPCIPNGTEPCVEGVIIHFTIKDYIEQYGKIGNAVSRSPIHKYEYWGAGQLPIGCGGSVKQIY